MKYCPQCGLPVDDQARFCSTCGAPLVMQEQEEPRPLHTGQLVFSIINMILGFLLCGIGALFALLPLFMVLNAAKAPTRALEKNLISAAFHANLTVLFLNVTLGLLFGVLGWFGILSLFFV